VIAAWEVVAAHETRTRLEVEADRGLTPFVGRERELGSLVDAFERARTAFGASVVMASHDADARGIAGTRYALEDGVLRPLD